MVRGLAVALDPSRQDQVSDGLRPSAAYAEVQISSEVRSSSHQGLRDPAQLSSNLSQTVE